MTAPLYASGLTPLMRESDGGAGGLSPGSRATELELRCCLEADNLLLDKILESPTTVSPVSECKESIFTGSVNAREAVNKEGIEID